MCPFIWEKNEMHNIISSNQLAEWQHFDPEDASYKLDQITDYYDCLIECQTEHSDKSICNHILTT